MIAKCLNCNRDYEQETQGAICPHDVGGPNSSPPWPKKHILGMEPDSVLRQMIRNHFWRTGSREILIEDIILIALQFNEWLVSTNETLQKLVLDKVRTELPVPIIIEKRPE